MTSDTEPRPPAHDAAAIAEIASLKAALENIRSIALHAQTGTVRQQIVAAVRASLAQSKGEE